MHVIASGKLPGNDRYEFRAYTNEHDGCGMPFDIDIASLANVHLPTALRRLADAIERIHPDDPRGRPHSASLILSDETSQNDSANVMIGVIGKPPSIPLTRDALANYTVALEDIINEDQAPITPKRAARNETVNVARLSLAVLEILAQSSARPNFEALARATDRHVGVATTIVPASVVSEVLNLLPKDYVAWAAPLVQEAIAALDQDDVPDDGRQMVDLRDIVQAMRRTPYPGDRS